MNNRIFRDAELIVTAATFDDSIHVFWGYVESQPTTRATDVQCFWVIFVLHHLHVKLNEIPEDCNPTEYSVRLIK